MEEAIMPTVAPEKILKQLADLWVAEGKHGEDGASQGVLRACTMTLVVLADESDDVSSLGETLAALMPEHPARTIVIRLRAEGERALSERVYAQCWMPFGQRRQICCEQVEITASDAALPDLPSVVLPLAVADLPLILWCRSARVLTSPEFRQLAEMATRVVMNSSGFPDTESAFRWLTEAVAPGNGLPPVADLAWTQLTRWREMFSQLFENRKNLERLKGNVEVLASDSNPIATRARYFAAWIKDGLESLGAQARVRIRAGSASVVELTAGNLAVRLEREDERLITTVDGVSNCTNLPLPNDYLLLREELGIMGRDPVFEKTLASAARLAYATE
jgi:glucose-6-phosphate dehydrogenase assembly protein OpcA